VSFFRNIFDDDNARQAPPEQAGVEMTTYSQIKRTHGADTKGRIDLRSRSYAAYKESASDLTILTINSKVQGDGSRMMNMLGEEAARLGKGHVRTDMTALSAHNFYLKMGLHPSEEIKQLSDQQFGSVHQFNSTPVPGKTNAEGNPMGRFTTESLKAFGSRLRAAKINNAFWEGETGTVRTQSAAHWKK
jgi:hypothetical protein